jgi:hypothetical protein
MQNICNEKGNVRPVSNYVATNLMFANMNEFYVA